MMWWVSKLSKDCFLPWPGGSLGHLVHQKVAVQFWSEHISRLWVWSMPGAHTRGNRKQETIEELKQQQQNKTKQKSLFYEWSHCPQLTLWQIPNLLFWPVPALLLHSAPLCLWETMVKTCLQNNLSDVRDLDAVKFANTCCLNLEGYLRSCWKTSLLLISPSL